MTNPRPRLLFIVAPALLGIAGCGLAIWGKYLAQTPHSVIAWADLVYSGLRSIGLSDSYQTTTVKDSWSWQLEAARWIGAVVAFWAVLALFYNGVRTTRIRLMVQMRRRHLIVVGDTPFAQHFCQLAAATKSEVVHLNTSESFGLQGELVRVPYTPGHPNALAAGHAATARGLLIALDDDAEAADLAIQAQARYPHLNIATRLVDQWLAARLHSISGAEKLRAFTEADAAAREIIRRHPPYLTAQDLGHSRIHSLMIGDHDWLEALAVETMLSACTLTFGKPAFTFVSLDPAAFRARLFDRYPDLANAADVAFFAAKGGGHASLSPQNRDDLDRLGAITAAYCALEDATASLSTALALHDLVLHDPAFAAPIFVHARGQGMPRPVPGSRLTPSELVPFGALSDIGHATGILSVHGQEAEKAWHKAYMAIAPSDKQAAKPWEELPEEFRISNQRAVAHMYAKLFEAGFDLRPWLAGHDPWAELPTLAPGETLWRDEAQRTRLAELEHERWIADRRMSGWVAGQERDNARKVHDNIVRFAQLSDETKGYDYLFIDLLNKVLKRSKNGLRRHSL